MTWPPFRKRPAAAAPNGPALREAETTLRLDTTDPLGSPPSFDEEARLLGQSEFVQIEMVSVQRQGKPDDGYLRLVVAVTALADPLRALLLEGPDELTGFRDLLAADAPLAAALEPPDFTLAELLSDEAPRVLRVAELRQLALWLLELCALMRQRGLHLAALEPWDLGFTSTGLELLPRFLGWTAVRPATGPPNWAAVLTGGCLLPVAQRCLQHALAKGMQFAVPAAEQLATALACPDQDEMLASLERFAPRCLMHGATDPGRRRPHNEDAWLAMRLEQASSSGVELTLAAVADGMGGHAAGEVASSLALDLLRGGLSTSLLLPRTRPHDPQALLPAVEGAILSAGAAISEKALLDAASSGMGTTIAGIACLKPHSTTSQVRSASAGCIFWVGDSRVYLIDYSGLRQLSHDHSYVQTLVDNGQLDAEEAWAHPQKNVVTRCLGGGGGSDSRPEVRSFQPGPGEIVLVCSDGLSDALRDSAIEAVAQRVASLKPGRAEPGLLEQLAAELISAANAAGGPDNISVVLLAG